MGTALAVVSAVSNGASWRSAIWVRRPGAALMSINFVEIPPALSQSGSRSSLADHGRWKWGAEPAVDRVSIRTPRPVALRAITLELCKFEQSRSVERQVDDYVESGSPIEWSVSGARVRTGKTTSSKHARLRSTPQLTSTALARIIWTEFDRPKVLVT